MDFDGFTAAIRQMGSVEFCRQHLFDQGMWLFSAESGIAVLGTYADLKLQIAAAVDINPNNVAIVGSAKYGFSMNPAKGYRPFSAKHSDVDIVIVSEELFNNTWREMREAIYNGNTVLKNRHAYEIIMRFVVLRSSQAYNTRYLRETALTIEKLSASLNRSTRLDIEFKYRVYATWKDVEMYHANGIAELSRAA